MARTAAPHTINGGRVRRTVTPRSRGALTGLGLVLLGAWGALIPFVGPYFDYAYTPDKTWTWTAARFWLQVVPGGIAFFAGLLLLFTAHRVVALLSAWAAIAAGAWFVVGPLLAPIWRANYLGTPVGDRTDVSVEQIGMFYGLGAAIILLAAMAAGRFSVVGVRDMELASAAAAAPETAAEPVAAEPVAAEPVAPAVERTIVMPDAQRVERTHTSMASDSAAMPADSGASVPADAATSEHSVGDTRDAEVTEEPRRHRRFVFR
ncbi:MAG TPA: hypothetical protein VHX15_14615 [Frankiaceae bacterium]|jgi:hypothetical protein|nr:hypothetical protein [Frankiaceae bacterium]